MPTHLLISTGLLPIKPEDVRRVIGLRSDALDGLIAVGLAVQSTFIRGCAPRTWKVGDEIVEEAPTQLAVQKLLKATVRWMWNQPELGEALAKQEAEDRAAARAEAA